MSGLRLPSFAKVNLGLEVLGPRRDGYHELRTIFQSIALKDEIVLTPRRGTIEVVCDHPEVPSDGRNLAAKAARLLQAKAGTRRGARIEIKKWIPVAAGLGGGSSNAAAVLQGLNRLWRTGLDLSELQALARRVGADVPFFLHGGTALGVGRGDEVYPLRHQLQGHVVVVAPRIPLSTAAVFARQARCLTPRENSYTIFRFVSRDLEGVEAWASLSNDLEEAALEEAPGLASQVRRIRRVLVREGARLALLSGSGSAYFGLFADPAPARRARTALAGGGFEVSVARMLTLDRYRGLLGRALEDNKPGRGQTR